MCGHGEVSDYERQGRAIVNIKIIDCPDKKDRTILHIGTFKCKLGLSFLAGLSIISKANVNNSVNQNNIVAKQLSLFKFSTT